MCNMNSEFILFDFFMSSVPILRTVIEVMAK
jgi:hypothetical protein